MHALRHSSSLVAASIGGPPVPVATEAGSGYRPGVCNIGAAEIANRRRSGHVGLVITAVSFVLLVALHVPAPVRFVIALPAAVTAICYLEAQLRFCAGFGILGLFNFGARGTTTSVAARDARAEDRAQAVRLALAGFAIGAVVGLVAVLLPV
jgi:hypothetical protein